MAPLNTTIDQLKTVFETHTVNVSDAKHSATNQYPFHWVSLRNKDTQAFYSGIQIVLKNVNMNILFNNGNGSLLAKLDPNNTALTETIQCIDQHIRDALPDHIQHSCLQPLRRIPLLGDPSIGLKCRFCSVDPRSTTTELDPRSVIQSCILTIQKLSSYNGKMYIQTQLTAAILKESTDCETFENVPTDSELFDMMDDC